MSDINLLGFIEVQDSLNFFMLKADLCFFLNIFFGGLLYIFISKRNINFNNVQKLCGVIMSTIRFVRDDESADGTS